MAVVHLELPDAIVAAAEAGGLLAPEAMTRLLAAELKRTRSHDEALALLRADIAAGDADIAAGRVKPLDAGEIVRLGKQRSRPSG